MKGGATRDEADEWLARYPDDASVMAYIGRSGWNTLTVGGAIPDDEILEAVDESYAPGGRQAAEEAPARGLGGGVSSVVLLAAGSSALRCFFSSRSRSSATISSLFISTCGTRSRRRTPSGTPATGSPCR